ncbi:MAG: hypothetical protein GXX86_09505, partial [Propionibacterium sp.]|nr:hypothetical protein [Propionibacterium sp.]
LKEGADDQYAAQAIPVLPGLLPEPARAWRVHHYLSAPPELVADVIASEQLLPTWSVESDTYRLDGDVVTVGKGSKTMSVQFEITRGHRDEVLTVDITQRLLDTKYAGEALSYDHFEVRPAPGGSEVIRDTGRRAFGLLGRAIAPFTGRVQTWGLLHSRYQIAFAVADRQAR